MGAFWKIKNIWIAKRLPTALKVRLCKASCLSILLYGCEAWTLTQQHKNILDSYATSCYRIMLNIKRLDLVTNEEVYSRVLNQKPLYNDILQRQLSGLDT